MRAAALAAAEAALERMTVMRRDEGAAGRQRAGEGGDRVEIRLVNIGFGNVISAQRIVAVVSPDSARIKRMIRDAREAGKLIDATYGRRTRAVIFTDSLHVILSAVQPETVAHRVNARDAAAPETSVPGEGLKEAALTVEGEA